MASIPAEKTKFLYKLENWHRFVFALISEEFFMQKCTKVFLILSAAGQNAKHNHPQGAE